VLSNLILAPSFRLLRERLLREIRTRDQGLALAPRWVVTPTSTVAADLRKDLQRLCQEAVIPGVRIVPLLGLVQRLIQVLWRAPAPRWSPLLELRLFRLIEGHTQGTTLQPLRGMGSGQLLRAAFLDLAEAGFGPDEIELMDEIAAAAETDDTASDALRLYIAWLMDLEENNVAWAPLQQQRLAEAVPTVAPKELAGLFGGLEPAQVRLYVYGFYDLTDVSALLLAALARRIPTDFFLPFSGSLCFPHPGFTFMRPVIDDLSARLGSSLGRTEILEPHEGLTRFFISTFPDGVVEAQPASLTFQHASGLRAEVLAAAARVRSWLDDPELALAPQDVILVAPQAEPYLDLVREIFEAFALPLRVADVPAALTPPDRALRAVARLWQEQAPSEWLLAYCREFPQLPCLKTIDLDAFESKLRKTGFDGRDWPGLLELAERAQLDEAERAFVAEIVDRWVGDRQALLPAGEGCRQLEEIARQWLPDPTLLSDVIAAFREVPEAMVPLSFLFHLLREQEGQGHMCDPADQPGILFSGMMRARGLCPRAVVVLGLAAGQVPFQVEEDPLLTDGLRLQLSSPLRDLGHRLAPKSLMTEEMMLLFMLLNGSADLVHWVIPDSDENGRAVAPTPWVQRYLQRWEKPPDHGSVSSRMPRGPAEQARLLLSLDPKTGRFLPPAFAAYLDRDLGSVDDSVPYSHLLKRQQEKQRDPTRNGMIPQAALGGASGRSAIRVTELERLSKCPFQFYSRVIAGWDSLTALEFSPDLKATEWGTLIHRLFENTLNSFPRGRKQTEIAEALLDDDCSALVAQVDSLPDDTSLQFALMPPLLRRAARNKLLQVSREYWQAVKKGDIPDGVTVCTEKRSSVPFPGLARVLVSGQIDRLEDRGTGQVVIDYKSGREPDNLGQEMRVGFRLQPLLYRWLARQDQPEGSPPTRFSYVFFGRTPIRERPVADDDLNLATDWLENVFAPILSGGLYLSISNEALESLGFEKMDACQYCEFVSLCRRFERGAPERFANLLQKYVPDRLKRFESQG
jgi:hypothetical protein